MLEKKIQNINDFEIILFGTGYVGLPTAVLFAKAGINVAAVDLNSEIVNKINNCISPIEEPGLQSLIASNISNGRLKAFLKSEKKIDSENVVIITVQTPIDQNNDPNLSYLLAVLEDVGKQLKKHMLVVICSTLPPQTMDKKIRPLLESLSGLNAEDDFYLAYVPERISPGIAIEEFVENPRLIGGIGSKSTKIATALFRKVCKNIIETDAITAEIAKTAENTFRDVNIAFANQLAIICEQNGADMKNVINVTNTHPRVNIHNSGPGVGGPCLTKDPYLLKFNISLDKNDLIETSRKINDAMSNHVVSLAINALNTVGKKIENARIAILGIAYKADVGDSRFSPSESIIRLLNKEKAIITSYDPYCPDSFGAIQTNSINECVKDSDCLIIATDHRCFYDLDLSEIRDLMNIEPILVDARRLIDPNEAKLHGFTYCGVGYGK